MAADVLGIPVGTVRSRLYRARRHLQEKLIQYAIDAGFGRVSAPTIDTRSTRTTATTHAES